MGTKLFIITLVGMYLFSTMVLAEKVRVYFGSSESKGIYVSTFDMDSGELSLPKLAIKIKNPGFIVAHPNDKFIYSTTSLSGGKAGAVAALKVNDDGMLTLVNKQSSGGGGPCHVSLDATGKSLMVANYSSGTVAALKINDDGSLGKSLSVHKHEGSVPNSKWQKGPHPHSIYEHPKNGFVYVPDLGIDKVMIYKLNPDKAILTAAGFVAVPGKKMGPRHMKWSADGKYAYLLNELGCAVTVFKSRWRGGKLKYKASLRTLIDENVVGRDDMSASEIRIHPNGKFIYAATRDDIHKGRDTIAVFSSFSNSKEWHRIELVSAEVSEPRNFNIDPSGKWMLVGGQASHDIAIFSIDTETGKLVFTGRKIAFAGSPTCIEFKRETLIRKW